MRPLDLELAPRPRYSAAGIALLAGAIAAAAALGTWHAQVHAETAALEERKSELARNARRAPLAPGTEPASGAAREEELRAARHVIGRLTVPWNELFLKLETAGDRRVALLGVHPDATGGQVLINGEAKSLRAVLDYSRRLEQTGVLSGVVLLGHTIRPERPGGAVDFSLAAAWQPQR